MNIVRINKIRAGMGLAPVTAKECKPKNKNTEKNRIMRGNACRELKALRTGGKRTK